MAKIPKQKIFILASLIFIYVLVGIGVKLLVMNGIIAQAPVAALDENITDQTSGKGFVTRASASLAAAQQYTQTFIVRDDGHVRLYVTPAWSTYAAQEQTNSEAMSYYLLWTAQAADKPSFDKALDYMQTYMQHPAGYLMWRVESNGSVIGEGENIASDADLRAIKALLIAKDQWNDPAYDVAIDRLAQGLEAVAITRDGMLAPYGGGSVQQPWTANEIWLSYEDFTVMQALSQTRGEPWTTMYALMKNATLQSQIHNGLYNSQLTEKREHGNGIDGGGYSINSLWIMVRSAESGDVQLQESARRSLAFYKEKYDVDAQLFGLYSSNGNALSSYDAPWVYALVGRAAVALRDEEFSDKMVERLLSFQVTNTTSTMYGAFPEGGQVDLRVGQFTMQESITTLQDYVAFKQSIAIE